MFAASLTAGSWFGREKVGTGSNGCERKVRRGVRIRKFAPALPNATGEYSQGANFVIVINALSTLIG
jgi:hypothetical protein